MYSDKIHGHGATSEDLFRFAEHVAMFWHGMSACVKYTFWDAKGDFKLILLITFQLKLFIIVGNLT